MYKYQVKLFLFSMSFDNEHLFIQISTRNSSQLMPQAICINNLFFSIEVKLLIVYIFISSSRDKLRTDGSFALFSLPKLEKVIGSLHFKNKNVITAVFFFCFQCCCTSVKCMYNLFFTSSICWIVAINFVFFLLDKLGFGEVENQMHMMPGLF